MDKLKRVLGLLLLATALWLGWVFSLQTGWGAGPAQKGAQALIAWEAYSDERLEELKKDKRIVLIDFTAAWCLTCQVNERVALDVPETAAAFKKMNVAALKADWTSQDKKVSQALARYGRSSIPFYVIHDFRGGEKPPVYLPEILGPGSALEALEGLGYNSKEEGIDPK